jgi:hypothetical protein
MQDASHNGTTDALVLQKLPDLSGNPAWFAEFYEEGSAAEKDRKLFSH